MWTKRRYFLTASRTVSLTQKDTRRQRWEREDTWRGTRVMVEAVVRWMQRTVGSCSILSSLSVSWNPRIVSRMYVAFVTRSVFFPVLGHSMMDTLAVALRVAEEAIEEAISKAESHGDSLVGPPSYGGARVRR